MGRLERLLCTPFDGWAPPVCSRCRGITQISVILVGLGRPVSAACAWSEAVGKPLEPLEAIFDALYTLLSSHAGLPEGLVGGAIAPDPIMRVSTDGQGACDGSVDVLCEAFHGGPHSTGRPSECLTRAVTEDVIDAVTHHQETCVCMLHQSVGGAVPQHHIEGFAAPCAEESAGDVCDLTESVEGQKVGRVGCEPDCEEVGQRQLTKPGGPVALWVGVERKGAEGRTIQLEGVEGGRVALSLGLNGYLEPLAHVYEPGLSGGTQEWRDFMGEAAHVLVAIAEVIIGRGGAAGSVAIGKVCMPKCVVVE